MAMSIKNTEVERLAAELARLTGESKTEAIRKALLERRQRLSFRVTHVHREGELTRFLEREVWPTVPPELLGAKPSQDVDDEILGYGPEGV
jgi:antitoxin VapB